MDGESPEERFWAVAQAVAQGEHEDYRSYWSREFYHMLANLDFLPNSPTLRNAGRPGGGTLSACFVVGLSDSWDGIAECRRQAGWAQKYGGGTGFDLSVIRPRGWPIRTTQGSACGPVAVLKDLNQLSETLTQGHGAFRKGANMGILSIEHPDILEFIHVKDDGVTCQNFNISVAVPDAFMHCLAENGEWELRWKDQVVARVPARELWQAICESAWRTGDPGLYFVDRAERDNPTPHLGRLSATNPCGEVPLLPYESCNLGSINLAHFSEIEDPFADTRESRRLRNLIHTAVRFLDDVVTVNEMPTKEFQRANLATRKIGLGVMGWHDYLLRRGLRYESDEAIQLGELFAEFFREVALEASEALGRERGSYPEYSPIRAPRPRRNATVLSIAPTGTISIIADCSSGIEPVFARSWIRRMEDGTELEVRHPFADAPHFSTALEIPPEAHVRMQAAWQRSVDLGVSKTVNLPNSATVEDVKSIYFLAWQLGCKGITVFRDGCRAAQVLTSTETDASESTSTSSASDASEALDNMLRVVFVPKDVPYEIAARRRHVTFADGSNLYIHVGLDEDGAPLELFLNAGKAGSTMQGLLHALARTISTALQYDVPLEAIIRRLRGMTFTPNGRTNTPDIPTATSLVDYLASYLEQYLDSRSEEHAEAKSSAAEPNALSGVLCPQCGSGAQMAEGCLLCPACGYSRCG
jgi:ribonucleoside-diphosphate reductase alpha chain